MSAPKIQKPDPLIAKSSDSLYFLDLRHFLFDKVCDAMGQGHLPHRASPTSAQESDFDHAVFSEIDKLNISAISLKMGPYFL